MPDPEFPITTRRRNSEWADLFGGASTNAAQRQRYAQDQELYAQDLLEQQEQRALDMAHKDKTHQDFYFRQKDLDRRLQMDSFTRSLRDREQQRKDVMLPLEMDTEAARSEAQQALAIARLNKDKRDASNALRVAQDTDSFEAKTDQLLQAYEPGSKAFADEALKIAFSHRYVPSDMRRALLAQADIDQDPDQLMRDTAKFRDTHNTTLRMNDKSKWSVVLTEKAPVKPGKPEKPDTYEDFNKDLEQAKKAYSGPLPPFIQKAFEDRGRRLESETVRRSTAPASTSAPVSQTAMKPLTEEVAKTARAAIAAGKDAAAVAARLKESGYDPSGL